MEIKNQVIDRHDCGKYSSTSDYGDRMEARLWYNDDGSLDEKKTYSRGYYAKLHHEESQKKETKSDQASHKKSSKKKNRSHKHTRSSKNEDSILDHWFLKIFFTIILVLPIWWIIKCPFYWISYPIRKIVKASNDKGNVVLPTYRFQEGDDCLTIIAGTVTLTLPLWWLLKLIGNLLTFLPRLILNQFTINNANLFPYYSLTKF